MSTFSSTTSSYTNIEDAFTDDKLNFFDILVILLYFLSVLGVGLWAMVKTNQGTVGGYFLAGRNMLWWPIGASLFASNIGSGHFIGLAGTGSASGLAVGAFEWNAMFVVLLLAWIFLPVYIASQVVTMPQYLKRRFGGNRIEICISFLYLFIYIFTKISVDMYAGAIFISQALKWNLFACVFILLMITGLYTIAGGLSAVIYTDILQTLIMIIGSFILMIKAFLKIGGYEALEEAYSKAIPTIRLINHTECGLPRQDAFHVFRSINSDFPWTGVVFGMPILSICYWCTDQVIVQRALAAKNLTHAKGATLFCSYLKVFPMFLMVMVGMISRSLYPDEVGCVVPEVCLKVCQNPHSCSDIAYPKLVLGLMPQGARGLMIAVMLSALMSSLTSIFNSSSTIFTMDLWAKFRKNTSERELMIVGRLFILILAIFSCIWIPIIQAEEGGQLFTYIQKISSYLQPPVAICFCFGIFWHRTNEQSAFYGLFFGTIFGIVRLVIDFTFPDPVCGEEDTRPSLVRDVHYLHFAIISALLTSIIIITISLLTKPQDKLNGLTWWLRHHQLDSDEKTENLTLVANDRLNYQQTSPSESTLSTAPPSVRYNGNKVQFVNPIALSNLTSEDPNLSSRFDPCKKLFNLFCGLQENLFSNQNPVIRDPQQLLNENPFWKRINDINLCICLLFAGGMWFSFR